MKTVLLRIERMFNGAENLTADENIYIMFNQITNTDF